MEPNVPLPDVLMVVPVAFVNVRRWRDESPVAVNVPTWKLPEPVAFVNVMFVEETVVATMVPMEKLPEDVIVPVPETANFVLEFTWKLMKSPLNPLAGFEPMKVPVVCDP